MEDGSIWQVRLLGELAFVGRTQTVQRFRTQQTASLAAYLAFHAGRLHSRELLAELFWPEVDEIQARQSLRQSLSSLRQQLEPLGIPRRAVLRAEHDVVRDLYRGCRILVVRGGERSAPPERARAQRNPRT